MIINRKDIAWFITSIKHTNKDISDADLAEQLAKYMETNPSCIDMDGVPNKGRYSYSTVGYGVFTKLIEANTTIPTKKTEVFSTAQDSQSSVEIHILQGERPMAKDNKSLGKFHLDGIMPAPRGVPQIEVTLDLDSNSILTVSAKDKASGKQTQIRIEGGSQLSKEEIERMKQEAAANAESDKKEKERVDKINKADSLIFQTEKQMKEFSEKLTEDDKSKLNESLTNLKDAHKIADLDKIDSGMTSLNETWNAISTRLYQDTSSTATADTTTDTATDAEYEEIK